MRRTDNTFRFVIKLITVVQALHDGVCKIENTPIFITINQKNTDRSI
jgi:hypothetical protein